MPLFQIGVVTVTSPGPFNATDVSEEFGSDFGVKPLVGSRQDREFDGPADQRLTISGTLFPYFFKRAGQETGLTEIEMLRKMCDEGKPQTVTRGLGVALGSFYVEKVTQKSSRLSESGIGQVITYEISRVRSLRDPDREDQMETLFVALGSLSAGYGG